MGRRRAASAREERSTACLALLPGSRLKARSRRSKSPRTREPTRAEATEFVSRAVSRLSLRVTSDDREIRNALRVGASVSSHGASGSTRPLVAVGCRHARHAHRAGLHPLGSEVRMPPECICQRNPIGRCCAGISRAATTRRSGATKSGVCSRPRGALSQALPVGRSGYPLVDLR